MHICFDSELIDMPTANKISSLRNTSESGVIRNLPCCKCLVAKNNWQLCFNLQFSYHLKIL